MESFCRYSDLLIPRRNISNVTILPVQYNRHQCRTRVPPSFLSLINACLRVHISFQFDVALTADSSHVPIQIIISACQRYNVDGTTGSSSTAVSPRYANSVYVLWLDLFGKT